MQKGGKMGEVYNKYMTTGGKLHFIDVETGEYVYDTNTGGVGESETYNPPKMTGWICPVCGRGLSPYTSCCPCKPFPPVQITC